jgi:hypothetical protein
MLMVVRSQVRTPHLLETNHPLRFNFSRLASYIAAGRNNVLGIACD